MIRCADGPKPSFRRRQFWRMAGILAVVFSGCDATVVDGWQTHVSLNWEDDAVTRATTGFETALGYRVVLEEVILVSSGVGVRDCTPSFGARLLQRLLGPSPAYAHLPDTPTQIGTTVVQRLHDDAELAYGTLRPPLGSYCGVQYIVLAADEDAFAISDVPTALGLTVLVRGTFSRGDDVATAFQIAAGRTFDGVLPILDLEGQETTLRGRAAQVDTLRVVRDPTRWFDAVDFASGLTPDRLRDTEDAVLIAVVASTRVVLNAP